MLQFANLARKVQPAAKLPFMELGWWFWWVLNRLLGKPPLDILRATWGPAPKFDSSKAREELGMAFIGASESVEDMAGRLEELGVV